MVGHPAVVVTMTRRLLPRTPEAVGLLSGTRSATCDGPVRRVKRIVRMTESAREAYNV